MRLYLFNLLIGLDQFANVVIGGAPDVTISTRAWTNRKHWAGAFAVTFIDWLFSWQEAEHCKRSAEGGDRQVKAAWGE